MFLHMGQRNRYKTTQHMLLYMPLHSDFNHSHIQFLRMFSSSFALSLSLSSLHTSALPSLLSFSLSLFFHPICFSFWFFSLLPVGFFSLSSLHQHSGAVDSGQNGIQIKVTHWSLLQIAFRLPLALYFVCLFPMCSSLQGVLITPGEESRVCSLAAISCSH